MPSGEPPPPCVGADLLQSAAAVHPPSAAPDPGTFDIAAPPEPVVFLPDLSAEGWRRLLARTERRVAAPGETVVARGAVDRGLYLVRRGRLAVVIEAGGRERNLTLIPAGSVFGEQSFADGRPRSATIRAIDEAEVYRLDWEAYTALAADDPALAREIMADLARILSERLRLTTAFAGRLAG